MYTLLYLPSINHVLNVHFMRVFFFYFCTTKDANLRRNVQETVYAEFNRKFQFRTQPVTGLALSFYTATPITSPA